jgi:transketolase
MARFAASGWDVFECDGHDPEDIDRALTEAKASPRPAMVACKTHIALGHAAQDTAKGHGALTDGDLASGREEGLWLAAWPLRGAADIKAEWEAIGARGAPEREEWETRFALLSDNKQAEFRRAFAGEMPKRLSATIRALKKQVSTSRPEASPLARPRKWRWR